VTLLCLTHESQSLLNILSFHLEKNFSTASLLSFPSLKKFIETTEKLFFSPKTTKQERKTYFVFITVKTSISYQDIERLIAFHRNLLKEKKSIVKIILKIPSFQTVQLPDVIQAVSTKITCNDSIITQKESKIKIEKLLYNYHTLILGQNIARETISFFIQNNSPVMQDIYLYIDFFASIIPLYRARSIPLKRVTMRQKKTLPTLLIF
jgi:hypothetical protein